MSTISTSLNSGATIMMTDYYKRYFNKGADDWTEIIFLKKGAQCTGRRRSAAGSAVIAWITLLQGRFESLPQVHTNLSIVLGTIAISIAGFLLTTLSHRE